MMEKKKYKKILGQNVVVNKPALQKLVDALCGGDYKQGQGQLREQRRRGKGIKNFYCCLGVACDLVAGGTLGDWEEVGGQYSGEIEFNDDDGMLPPGVALHYFGNKNITDPKLLCPAELVNRLEGRPGKHLPTHATDANDELHLTLKQIGEAFKLTYLG